MAADLGWRIVGRYLGGRIVVTARSGDYHACAADNPGMWACGRTVREAVGALVESHGDSGSLLRGSPDG